MQEAPGQPNRIRAIRTATGKYADYFDPEDRVSSEYELYDLERDPDERDNLLDVRTGEAPRAVDVPRHHELRERLTVAMAEAGTA